MLTDDWWLEAQEMVVDCLFGVLARSIDILYMVQKLRGWGDKFRVLDPLSIAIESHVPEKIHFQDKLHPELPEFPAKKFIKKTCSKKASKKRETTNL